MTSKDAGEDDSRDGPPMAQLTRDNMAWLTDGQHSAPPKRYRIGELARHTGLTRQTLHNYTHWGLIKETEWTPGGHRLYDEDVFARLSHILRLRKQHTVQEIKDILDPSPANTDCIKPSPSDEAGGS